MTRKRLEYIRWYFEDYLRDTTHLSHREHGAYFLILMRYAQTQIPPRENRIASQIGMSSDEWAEVRDELAMFFTVVNGVWKHKRIEAELKRVRSVSAAARLNGKVGGKRSGESRRRSKNEAGAAPDATASGQASGEPTTYKGEATPALQKQPENGMKSNEESAALNKGVADIQDARRRAEEGPEISRLRDELDRAERDANAKRQQIGYQLEQKRLAEGGKS